MGPKNSPGIIRLSEHIYRMLLLAYPTSFREAYGPYMVQVFRDTCLRTHNQKGPIGIIPFWIDTLWDFVNSVIQEHFQMEVFMSKTKLTRLSGWLLILAGCCYLIFYLHSFYIGYLVANNLFPPKPLQFFDSFIGVKLELALMWMLFFGFYGLFKREKEILGNLAPASIVFLLLGNLINSIYRITDRYTLRYHFEFLENSALGFLTVLGVIGFGIVLAIYKPLPKFNYIVLVTYLMPALFMQIFNFLGLQGWIFFPIVAIPPTGWIILGASLLSASNPSTSSGQDIPLAMTI